MLTIARNKFFNRYLPMFLSVLLAVSALIAYQILRPQTKTAEAAWYNTSGTWNYRKVITINHNYIASSTAETYANFPVLVSLTDPNLATYASSSGADILFTLSDGQTKLNHEIESYSSSTGALIAWVNVGASGLSTSTDATLYMYYGNASATSQQNATSTWDSNYKGVWHLNGSVNDSTVTGANLTSHTGTVAYSTGNIASALSLNGATNIYNPTFGLNSALDLTNATLSLWMKTSTSQSSWHAWATCQGSYGLYDNSDTSDYYDWGTSTDHKGTTNIDTNSWHYITLVKNDGVTNGTHVYLDGNIASPELTGIATRSTSGVDNTFNIGAGASAGGLQYFTGLVDEVQISNSLRSADWIKTEYNNQFSPSTFLSEGLPQNNPAGVAAPNNRGVTVKNSKVKIQNAKVKIQAR